MHRVFVLAATALFLGGCLATPTSLVPTPLDDVAGIIERQLTPKGGTASEVAIAANPKDPLNLVASANGAGGLPVYWTKDGGLIWTASVLPTHRVGKPNGAPDTPARFLGLGDPSLAFGPDGSAYLAGLAIIPTSGVFVAKSRDGGETWPQVTMVHESDLAASFNDKEWVGVSPKGTVIVVWQKEPLLDSLRGVEGQTGLDVDVGDIVFCRSTDGGLTWSLPMRVSRGLHNNGTQVVFTADGRGHMLWVNYETSTLDYVSSEDDGATWTTPKPIAAITYSGALPRYNRMHTLPGLAASPTTGVLAATWHDARNGDLDVYAVASPDGGKTWSSEVVRVNDDPVKNGLHQMFPWVAVDHNDRIHVTFYDARLNETTHDFYYFHAAADDTRLDFGENRPVSTHPFRAFSGPGSFRNLGDYTGLAATTAGLFPVWADARGERVGVFSSRVPLDW